MREEDIIKKRIMERLKSYTYYDIYCDICKRYLCRIARDVPLICIDCWERYRVKPEPPKQPLLEKLIDEIISKKPRQ